MNVLSTFDGMSCARMALERANVKIDKYYASEIKPHAIAVTQHNYPDTIQLGDVTKITKDMVPQIDLVCGGSPCFVAGTLVLTTTGYKAIESVVVGDMVLSHTGNWRRVSRIGNKHNVATRIIKGFGNMGIETTDEHPFYTRKMFRKWDKTSNKTFRKFSPPEWEFARSLDKTSYCAIPEIKTAYSKNEKEAFFWYMMGRYTGDGWYRKTKRRYRKNSFMYHFIICCGLAEFQELKEKFDKFGYHYGYVKGRTGYKFQIYDQDLVGFVEKIGRGASNKVVHPELFTSSLTNIKSYLDGLWDSDGCFYKETSQFRLTTVSKFLAMGVQKLIVTTYKRPVSLFFNKRPPTCIIEGRVCNQKDTYQLSFKIEKGKQDKAFFEDGIAWQPVKLNSPTNQTKTVYNLEVEIDNSYTANNFAVHNCQDLSAGNRERLGLAGVKSGLFYEYLRILEEVKPKFFLLENVIMDFEHSMTITNLLKTRPCRINSSLVSGQMRDRLYWTNIGPEDFDLFGNRECMIPQPKDKGITLQSVLESGWTDMPKSRCLLESDSRPLATPYKMFHRYYSTGFTTCVFKDEQAFLAMKQAYDATLENHDNKFMEHEPKEIDPTIFTKDKIRYLSQIELERLQTVQKNYTSILNRNQAACLLGDGWTVDVISHIFSFLPKEYKL